MKSTIAYRTFQQSINAGVAALLIVSALRAAEPVDLTIERDRITAGQLARVIPAWEDVAPATILGYAPRPGAQRQISRAVLVRWGRDQGLDLDQHPLPDSVLIHRATRHLGQAEAHDIVVRRLADSLQISPDNVHLEIEDYRPVLLPAGDLDFELPTRSLVFDRVTTLSIDWRDVDGRTGRFPLRAALTIAGQYAVAKSDLPTGAEITPDDFTFQQGPLPGPPDRFAVSPPDISGMQLRGSLSAGQSLDRRLLVVSKTIERGDLIEIRVRFRDVVLQTPARAEESGSVGERIQCRNLDSGRRVVARVVSPELAEVAAR